MALTSIHYVIPPCRTHSTIAARPPDPHGRADRTIAALVDSGLLRRIHIHYIPRSQPTEAPSRVFSSQQRYERGLLRRKARCSSAILCYARPLRPPAEVRGHTTRSDHHHNSQPQQRTGVLLTSMSTSSKYQRRNKTIPREELDTCMYISASSSRLRRGTQCRSRPQTLEPQRSVSRIAHTARHVVDLLFA
jgi:hypothetical protein